MTKKTSAALPPNRNLNRVEDSRLLPLAIAGTVCFILAVILGYGSWYFFGSKAKSHIEPPPIAENQPVITAVPDVPAATPTPTVEATPAPTPEPPKKLSVEGTVNVEGSEIAVGGEGTKFPLKRTIVGNFAIAETEVTNAKYAEFVEETKHSAPVGWKDGKIPEGEEDFPVTGVSWKDAEAFCAWLSKKIDLPVRLPTEAEWELAARGKENYKYPWGNDWNKDAVISAESGGKISAVKSFELNRSPFGAYDMAGNVWEWTADKLANDSEASDKFVAAALKNKQVLRIVKGGTSKDKAEQISARARYEIPETSKAPMVGFRYIVVAK